MASTLNLRPAWTSARIILLLTVGNVLILLLRNWTPALLIALSYLIEGFFIEGQNYFSATHGPKREILYTMAPAYWQYNLPYVNAYHLFEMPLIGYSGYLPFGVYCWLWWIAFATLQGIPSRFFQEAPFQPHKPETE